ncbi:MAG TPA: hypothetical protein VF950_06370 [Planctomycetota bacterium]
MRIATLAVLACLTAPQDKDKLKTALKDVEVRGDWVYDDLDAGLAQAKKAGKPAFVVFRCVP